jgi:hypothetical protein
MKDVIEDFIEFVWDCFGEAVANRWFDHYPSKYSRTEIKRRLLKSVKAA